jgi:hypothetical protein
MVFTSQDRPAKPCTRFCQKFGWLISLLLRYNATHADQTYLHFDDVISLSNKLTKYGFSNDAYYFIRRCPFEITLYYYPNMSAKVKFLIIRKPGGVTGKLVGIDSRPHDLRRSSATYASRSGTPIQIVSKIILRHVHL